VGEAAFLREHAAARTIVAVPSPYTIGRRMWSPEHSTKAYATREEFMEACILIVRDELQALARLGVDAVQLDDPWLALLVDPSYREMEGVTDVEREIDLCVRCVNGATEGVEGVHLSLHLCHAHWDRRHATKGPYDLVIGALGRMNVDRFAMEFATPDAGGIGVLKDFPQDKVLGLGVIDHTDTHVETPEEVAARVEAAMQFVPKERISLNPDCGFAPSSANPMDFDEAYLKLKAMCDGARVLRERYG
jgi:5-methyltetrahydropteroyltriglutamate--homocysteine methyltransferase